MSAFSGGSVIGKLGLDTTSFHHGFSEAHTHAQNEGGHIREVLESIAEVFSEALGPAAAQFGQQLQSVFAGFSEGPIIGSLNAIGTAFGIIRESVVEVGNEFAKLGIEAQKAGTSVEFLDSFADVAATTGVSLEQLSMGFKILEERAQAASEGDKKASESFQKLGIDSVELTELMKSPQALIEEVQHSIGGMTSAFERNSAAQGLFGKQGASLIPVFAMSKAEFEQLAKTLDRLKASTDSNSASMGRNFAILEAEIKTAFEGIAIEVSKPFLESLRAHSAEITAFLIQCSQKIRGAVDELIAVLPTLIAGLEGVAVVMGVIAALEFPVVLSAVATAATVLAGPVIALGAAIGAPVIAAVALGAAAGVLIHHFPVLQQYAEALGNIFKALGIVIEDQLVKAFHAVGNVLAKVTIDTSVLSAAWDSIAKGPLGPAMNAIVEIFREMGREIAYVQKATEKLVDKLMEAAGMAPGAGPKDKGTKGLTADEAREQLKSGGSFVGDGPKKGEGSGVQADTVETPKADKNASIRQEIFKQEALLAQAEQHPDGVTPEMKEKIGVTKAYVADLQKRLADTGSTNADPTTRSSGPGESPSPVIPKPEPQHAAPHQSYENQRVNLTDGRDVDGGKFVKTGDGKRAGTMSAVLDDEQYGNLRTAEKAARESKGASDRNRVIPGGEDSITAWRRTHPSQPDSIAKTTGGDGGKDLPKIPYDVARTNMTDAMHDDGGYHVKSGNGRSKGRMSATLDDSQYKNLRMAEADNRSGAPASAGGGRTIAADTGRASFDKLASAIDRNTAAVSGGGRSSANARPTVSNPSYAVNLTVPHDAKKTAEVLMPLLMNAILGMEKKHQQEVAGVMTAANVAGAMGGHS